MTYNRTYDIIIRYVGFGKTAEMEINYDLTSDKDNNQADAA